MAIVVLVFMTLLAQSVVAKEGTNSVFNVKNFGAQGDGKTLDTKPIQSAIDAAEKVGGGVVLLPPGTYLSGSLELKSHIELRIETNATLLGSTSHLDYKKLENPEYAWSLLLADNCEDISLAGGGIIDGQGLELAKDVFESKEGQADQAARLPLLMALAKADMESLNGQPVTFEFTLTSKGEMARVDGRLRPFLIAFRNCQHVKIQGVTMRNPCCYTQNYLRCSDLIIEGIKVESTNYWNNDGIDISDCRNVKVSNCDVNSEDDSICLKSERGGKGCWDVDVSDCRIRSSGNAFKCGTASWGGFHRIRARNLTVFDTFRSAIALESVDGGVLEDVVIEHVRATNTANAIFLRLGGRNQSDAGGQVENVIIRDVEAEVPAGKADAAYGEVSGLSKNLPHSICPASIVGLPGHPVQNILLEDIEISYPGGGSAAITRNSLKKVPENPTKYPDFWMFRDLPAWGFYVRHAEGIHFRNVRLSFEHPDSRPALVFDDVSDLGLEKTVVASASENPAMILEQVREAAFDVQFPPGFERVRINSGCEKITGLSAEESGN